MSRLSGALHSHTQAAGSVAGEVILMRGILFRLSGSLRPCVLRGAHALAAVLLAATLAVVAAAQPIEFMAPIEESNGQIGHSIAGIPDVDGDGRGDVIIGSPNAHPFPAPEGAGRAYIFSGSSGALLRELASPNAETRGYFGAVVAGIPDVDGDGRGDVVVGAYQENPNASPQEAGRAYIFSGSSGAPLFTLMSPNEEVFGFFGWAVAGIADADGDGRGDVVVGAYIESPGVSPEAAGRAYIFSGSSGALFRTLVSPNEISNGIFGFCVAGIADVNGDGRGDVVVGAQNESPGTSPDYAGRAYIYSGSTGTMLWTLASATEEFGGGFGRAVANVPDVNGDGREDVVVGASESPGASPDNAGRVHIFSGSGGAYLRTLVSPNEEEDGQFGYSVAGIGDVNGDGRGDVVVGAHLEAPPGPLNNSGRVYVFSGAGGAPIRTLISPHAKASGAFGRVVARVPDADGDGRDDVAAGAPFDAPFPSPVGAGRAYLFAWSDIAVVIPSGVLDFGAWDVASGPSATRFAVVANEASRALLNFIGAGATLTGADAAHFAFVHPPEISPVVASQWRALFLAFDPASPGVQSATLQITSDDPDEATVEITLLGTGTNPTPTPTATATPTHTPTFTVTNTPTPTNVPPQAFLFRAPGQGAAPLQVELSGTGFDPDGLLVQYRWSFTDWAVADATVAIATSSVEAATMHVYNAPGSYQLGFSVTDNRGATVQARSTVAVWTYTPTPTPTATPTPGLRQLSDINRDGVVDQLDLMILIQFWRMTSR